jgi:hypothetical protein
MLTRKNEMPIFLNLNFNQSGLFSPIVTFYAMVNESGLNCRI